MSIRSGRWSEEDVAGHCCEIFEPEKRRATSEVLIYLHGVSLKSLRDQSPFTEQFEQLGLAVVAPCTGPTWWTDRICPSFDAQMTAEQYVRENVLEFIHTRWGIAPPQIGLFGSSMGGQAALRMAYKYPRLFPVVAAISPAIDYQIRYREGDRIIRDLYDDAEAVRQDTATLFVRPLNWPRCQFFCCDPTDQRWIESAERLHMKLQSLGIPHQCDLETEAGGHGFTYYNHMARRVVTFLVEGLEEVRGTS